MVAHSDHAAKAKRREEFARRVTTKRCLLELTIAGLARKAGLRWQNVASYEGAVSLPADKNMKKLADALETTVEYLKGE